MNVTLNVSTGGKPQVRSGGKGSPENSNPRGALIVRDQLLLIGYPPERAPPTRDGEKSLTVVGELQSQAFGTSEDLTCLLLHSGIPEHNYVLSIGAPGADSSPISEERFPR